MTSKSQDQILEPSFSCLFKTHCTLGFIAFTRHCYTSPLPLIRKQHSIRLCDCLPFPLSVIISATNMNGEKLEKASQNEKLSKGLTKLYLVNFKCH